MKYCILLLFYSNLSFAQMNNSAALDNIQKAVLSYPITQQYKQNLEQKITSYIPLSKENIGIVGSIALTASSGKIETKPLKNLNLNLLGGNLRPNMTYDFRNREEFAEIVFTIDF